MRHLPALKALAFARSWPPGADGLHQSPLYSHLQGCLAAQALLRAPKARHFGVVRRS